MAQPPEPFTWSFCGSSSAKLPPGTLIALMEPTAGLVAGSEPPPPGGGAPPPPFGGVCGLLGGLPFALLTPVPTLKSTYQPPAFGSGPCGLHLVWS